MKGDDSADMGARPAMLVNSDQQAAVETLLAEQQEAHAALAAKMHAREIAVAEAHAALAALRQVTLSKLEALLDARQFETVRIYEALHLTRSMHAGGDSGMHGEDGMHGDGDGMMDGGSGDGGSGDGGSEHDGHH